MSGGTRATAQRARGLGRSPIETGSAARAKPVREAGRKSGKTFGERH